MKRKEIPWDEESRLAYTRADHRLADTRTLAIGTDTGGDWRVDGQDYPRWARSKSLIKRPYSANRSRASMLVANQRGAPIR